MSASKLGIYHFESFGAATSCKHKCGVKLKDTYRDVYSDSSSNVKTNEVPEMGNENEILAVYKRNSVTEWLQKTGQATGYVDHGNSLEIVISQFNFFAAAFSVLYIYLSAKYKSCILKYWREIFACF